MSVAASNARRPTGAIASSRTRQAIVELISNPDSKNSNEQTHSALVVGRRAIWMHFAAPTNRTHIQKKVPAVAPTCSGDRLAKIKSALVMVTTANKLKRL